MHIHFSAKRLLPWLAALVALTSANCDAWRIVARVGNEAVTVKDFRTYLFYYSADPDSFTTRAARRGRLNELIERRLKILDARRTGLDRDPELKHRLDYHRRQVLYRYTLEREVDRKAVPDSLVRAIYRGLSRAYVLQQIVLHPGDDPIALNRAWNVLQQLRSRLMRGESFDELARFFSRDELSAARGGRSGALRWGDGDLGQDFYLAVNRLHRGEISQPIRSETGLHLVQVLGHHSIELPPYPVLAPQIRAGLLRQRGAEAARLEDELKNRVREAYPVRYFESALQRFLRAVDQGRRGDPAVSQNAIGELLRGRLSADELSMPLFRIANRTFTTGQFVNAIGMTYPAGSGYFDSRADLKTLIGEMQSDEELIVEWGLDRGYDRHPPVRRVVRGLWEDELIAEIEKQRVHRIVPEPAEEEVRSFYQQHRGRYRIGKRMKVQLLVVPDLPLAEELAAQARAGSAFSALVLARSIHSSARQQGILGLISPERRDAVSLAAARMNVGEVSDPIPTGEGWAVIKLLELFPERDQSLRSVRSRVELDLRLERTQSLRKKWLHELKERNTVLIFQGILDNFSVPRLQ